MYTTLDRRFNIRVLTIKRSNAAFITLFHYTRPSVHTRLPFNYTRTSYYYFNIGVGNVYEINKKIFT